MKSFRSLRSLRLSSQAGTKLPLGGWGVGHLRKIHEPHRILFQNFVYPCRILPRQCFPTRGGADGWDDIYEEGVYLTLCFPAYRNFATFRNRWEQVSGRCLRGYVIHRIDREASCPKEGRVRLVGHYISAWASALLVLLYRAMRRPLCAGRVTGTDSRASFLYVYVSEGNRFLSGLGSLTGVWQISIISTWKRNYLLRLCTRTC